MGRALTFSPAQLLPTEIGCCFSVVANTRCSTRLTLWHRLATSWGISLPATSLGATEFERGLSYCPVNSHAIVTSQTWRVPCLAFSQFPYFDLAICIPHCQTPWALTDLIGVSRQRIGFRLDTWSLPFRTPPPLISGLSLPLYGVAFEA